MPVYIQCPHCGHPHVVTAQRRGRSLYCKQCGMLYQTSKFMDGAWPMAVAASRPRIVRQGARRVYVID